MTTRAFNRVHRHLEDVIVALCFAQHRDMLGRRTDERVQAGFRGSLECFAGPVDVEIHGAGQTTDAGAFDFEGDPANRVEVFVR